MISTRDLSGLPDVDGLRRLMQSIAMLDAILCPEWQYRYFSFNSHWSAGEQMGSMRNGQGDHYFALFNAGGCWLKGFAHESPTTPFRTDPPKVASGVLDLVPPDFAACLKEPAFVMDETTFCIWQRYSDSQWQHGPVKFQETSDDSDGSADLLQYLDGRPETYRAWAEGYYERSVPLAVVQHVYRHQELHPQLIQSLNPDITLAELTADIQEIGYPAVS